MWVVILIIIIVVLVSFMAKNKKQETYIAKQGGMKNKYKEIIEFILSQDKRASIINETGNSILLGLNSVGGQTTFQLVQTYGNLTVQWKMNSPMFGKHELEWTFNEFLDQDKMISKIENDLSKYQTNVMQKFN